ncbi:S8 family serine peptidase [Nocardioides zeae]
MAGSAGGYGVLPGGGTFAGNYASVGPKTLRALEIGPGMAPESEIYALRVFGCGGSTNEVIAALDWALDPNGDGDFSDHLDIINMSLGSAHVPADDPQNAVVDALTRHGILTVASNGNEGDLTDAGGSPGSATSSLAVASSVDAMQRRDAVQVTAPSDLAGPAAGQFSQAYPFATKPPVSGSVVAIPGSNADGCDAFSSEDAARVAGKIVWLEWDDVDATRRCGSVARAGNAKAAGAIGSIFTSDLDVFGAGISGDADIPVVQLTGTETARLRPAAAAGTLAITFDGDLAQSISTYDDAITDTVSGFTSRGGHGTFNGVKPDVAAPGDTISSAAVGTGSRSASLSGTSMAAPVTAGVAALVVAKHPEWTPLQVKAAIMNTATNDLFTDEGRTGAKYGPARVGAGRIDARTATETTTLAWTNGTNNPVSATFGVVNVAAGSANVTRSKTVTVRNNSSASVTYKLGWQGSTNQPGVRYTLSATSVTVPARSERSVTINMVVTPSAVQRQIDPTMDVEQLGVPRQFVSAASGRLTVTAPNRPALRVPVHGVARVNSTTTASVANQQLVLDGNGVDQGEGTARQRSVVSVLELGTRSGQMPICTGTQTVGCVDQGSDRGMDIQSVGAGSSSTHLWFGLDTWGDWATSGRLSVPFVDYDVNGDGTPDYETYLQFFPDSDVLYSITVDLESGDTVDQQPVNFFDADVDTNVFDTDVVLLPVRKAAIGLPTNGTTSAPITYRAGIYDANAGGNADVTGEVQYDAGTPASAPRVRCSRTPTAPRSTCWGPAAPTPWSCTSTVRRAVAARSSPSPRRADAPPAPPTGGRRPLGGGGRRPPQPPSAALSRPQPSTVGRSAVRTSSPSGPTICNVTTSSRSTAALRLQCISTSDPRNAPALTGSPDASRNRTSYVVPTARPSTSSTASVPHVCGMTSARTSAPAAPVAGSKLTGSATPRVPGGPVGPVRAAGPSSSPTCCAARVPAVPSPTPATSAAAAASSARRRRGAPTGRSAAESSQEPRAPMRSDTPRSSSTSATTLGSSRHRASSSACSASSR